MKINLMRDFLAPINQDGLLHHPLVLFDWFSSEIDWLIESAPAPKTNTPRWNAAAIQ